MNKQRKVITEITAQTIKSCCDDIDSKVIEKGTQIVDNIMLKVKDDNDRRYTSNQAKWEELKAEMTAANTQLVRTNRVAVNNNAKLQEKVKQAEHIIIQQTKKVQELENEVQMLETRTADVENRKVTAKQPAVHTYLNTVIEQVETQAKDYIHKYAKKESNIALQEIKMDITTNK